MKRTLGLEMSCHAESGGALFVGILQIGSGLLVLGKRHCSVSFTGFHARSAHWEAVVCVAALLCGSMRGVSECILQNVVRLQGEAQ